VKPEYEQEIAANLERAEKSIQAAKEMATSGFYDFAASRSFLRRFMLQPLHCWTKGWNSASIAGFIASIHQRLVKTGKLDKEQGKELNWLFELRNVGDYGVTIHVS